MRLTFRLIIIAACLAQLIETKPWTWEADETSTDSGRSVVSSTEKNGGSRSSGNKKPSPKRIGGKDDRKPLLTPTNRPSSKDDANIKRGSDSKKNQAKVFDSPIDSVKIYNRSTSLEASTTTVSSGFGVDETTVASATSLSWTPFVDPSLCVTSGPSAFCIDIINYPESMISSILAENGSTLVDYFPQVDPMVPSGSESSETIVESPEVPQSRKAKVQPTFSIVPEARKASSDQSQLCRSTTIEAPVKMARNTNGDYLAIVNQDNIRQTITFERCLNDNGPCQFAKNFPAGYEATCKQKYTKHHLAALKDGKIQQDTFVFPSCCVCEVKAMEFRNKKSDHDKEFIFPRDK